MNRTEICRHCFPVPFDVNILVYTAVGYRDMLNPGNLFLSSILRYTFEL